jgi:DNA-binding winged helix-turn-helix (wHTH) protein
VTRGSLHQGDASIHLTRKEIDLLLLLLEQRPNVVTKEQIYGHLWPNIFVSEASLQALVSDLREALDAGDVLIQSRL